MEGWLVHQQSRNKDNQNGDHTSCNLHAVTGTLTSTKECVTLMLK